MQDLFYGAERLDLFRLVLKLHRTYFEARHFGSDVALEGKHDPIRAGKLLDDLEFVGRFPS